MAHKAILQVNNGYGEMLVTFLANTIADVSLVPTNVAIGSKIICLENKKRYILSANHQWILQ